MSVLSIDFETRATVDLRKAGIYRYAEDPNTDIWCMAWAFDDEEVEIWTPSRTFMHDGLPGVEDNPLPERIVEHIKAGGEIRAWNAAFERIIWREIMVKRYGAPEVKIEQWVDTAAEAAAMSLPRGLDEAAQVTGVPFKKDQDGYGLMLRMTRPRKFLTDGTPVWWNVPERLERLYEYCKQDVRVERAIAKVMHRLTPLEREHYLETERANDRGIYLDQELVLAAISVADEGSQRANYALAELTGGAATEVTKVQGIKDWMRMQGHDVDSLDKASIRDMLTSDLAPTVRDVLELRAEAGRSSLAKLNSMTACVCSDGAMHGLMLYHGASTGRWTGKLVQPHNFPRGEVERIEEYIDYVLAENYDAIDLFYPPPVVISSMLRLMMVARPGHDFIAGDYSAIEARVLNWLAGQQDMVDLFRQYDAAEKKDKEKFDPYRHNGARLYRIELDDVKKFPHRQTGKFQELGCGYGMGHKKAVSAAKDVYGLIITETQAKEIVSNYRATHDKVVKFWEETDEAAKEAVLNPGRVVTFGALKNLRFVVKGAYLYLILPSHRALVYAAPRVVDRPTPWGEVRPAVEISAPNPKTKKWSRQVMYGGIWVENIVQALSRDLLAEAVLRLRDAGYPYVLTVHDEIVTEVPEGFGSIEEFDKLASALPEWATGLPVATESWRGKRYKK